MQQIQTKRLAEWKQSDANLYMNVAARYAFTDEMHAVSSHLSIGMGSGIGICRCRRHRTVGDHQVTVISRRRRRHVTLDCGTRQGAARRRHMVGRLRPRLVRGSHRTRFYLVFAHMFGTPAKPNGLQFL
jgi:hypothetical protein